MEEKHAAVCGGGLELGAGFHTQQPLNVGQPTVSQVVSSRSSQSRLDPSPEPPRSDDGGDDDDHDAPLDERAATAVGRCPSVRPSVSRSRRPRCPGRDWQTGKRVQHSAVMGSGEACGGGDASHRQTYAGFGTVDPLRRYRFLLMQTHVGYRSA